MTHPRRVFLMAIAATSASLSTLSTSVRAQAKVDEKDPQAAALGYVADTTKVDAKKYPTHTLSQACNNCALYQGKPADAAGPCPLFAGKVVSAKGWCTAWAKKA